MKPINNNVDILSDAEYAALYEKPEFDDEQRIEYLTLTDDELAFAMTRKSLPYQVACILQIGYFKAVQIFFSFDWNDVDSNDVSFILQQYFSNQTLERKPLSKHEYYTQCTGVANLFGYKYWDASYKNTLLNENPRIYRDIKPQSISLELLTYFTQNNIIRPAYTTFQLIVSNVINLELLRLTTVVKKNLSSDAISLLNDLLVDEDSLSKLAAIKADAKNFKLHMVIEERRKLKLLRPIYKIVKDLLPQLNLSQQNIMYFAELINFYSIYDLRKKVKIELAYLYMLCYSWFRYRQISDNLVNSCGFHFGQIEAKVKENGQKEFSNHIKANHAETINVIKLAQLYVDDTIPDDLSFGEVREKAFTIISRDDLINRVLSPNNSPMQESNFFWQSIDSFKRVIKSNLRNTIELLEFSSTESCSQWLTAINWIKEDFSKPNMLPLLDDVPENTLPTKLLPYLKSPNESRNFIKPRYEFWIYNKLQKYLKSGGIYLEDSLQYRSLNQELVAIDEQKEILKQLKIPALQKLINEQLDELLEVQHNLLVKLNKDLRKNKLKHLEYDSKTGILHWRKVKVNKDEEFKHQFYSQLPLSGIVEVLKFVANHCGFLSAFTHIQPRYAKQSPVAANLIATLIAQAMNNGNVNMAEISDIPYAVLQNTLQSRIRLNTLKAANDLISNGISHMSIFPFYSFDLELLYGGVDGQKFVAATPTIKARPGKKYYGKGKGVVAYTLLASHVPLQVELIGANDHESYFVFDIWYNNTSEINPDVITGDMHSINRANFAIMHCFGRKLYPRFTNVEAQRKHIFCAENLPEYDKFLIKPAGTINRELIESEWPNLQRIIASLGLKEISQSSLVRKLCTYTQEHRTRMALFEFDKLIRSIYTLQYLLNFSIYKNAHKSQNRVEQYHQLRGAVAQAYGKKEIIGKTDIAIEISNQFGRLISNAIIYYNSALLSKLKDKYEQEGNIKGLNRLKRIAPVAWQHIHFLGHLTFCEETAIDLDKMLGNVVLD